MATTKSQNSNMLLAFLTLLGVIAIVAVVVFSCFAKDLRLSKDRLKLLNIVFQVKVPGRILEFRVKVRPTNKCR